MVPTVKSIILNPREAKAYAAGTLTQLRRVCKPQPEEFVQTTTVHTPKHPAPYMDSYCSEPKTVSNPRGMSDLWCWWTTDNRPDCNFIKCPYGAPSDKLALRETWGIPDGAYPGTAAEYVSYRSDESTWHCHTNDAPLHRKSKCSGYISPAAWNSPVTMPLWAVRWHPVITAVRLERVQDMSGGDAVACGIQSTPLAWHYIHQFDRDNPRTPWESNPWVWVIDMEGLKA